MDTTPLSKIRFAICSKHVVDYLCNQDFLGYICKYVNPGQEQSNRNLLWSPLVHRQIVLVVIRVSALTHFHLTEQPRLVIPRKLARWGCLALAV